MFDGKGIFVWLGSIILSVLFFSTLCFIGSKMLKSGQQQKDKKLRLNQEKYGIEVAERMKKHQRIKDILISLAIIVFVMSVLLWLAYR